MCGTSACRVVAAGRRSPEERAYAVDQVAAHRHFRVERRVLIRNQPFGRRSLMRARIQQFGSFMAQMVIPNIGAILAWGLITALFIPTGWTPNAELAKLVGPMIVYMIPILIAFSGGRLVYGLRGGVVGAAAA